MSIELGEIKPIVIAEKLSIKGLVNAFLDSPIARTRIKFGKLNPDRVTATVGKRTILIDNSWANPGDVVVIHEIT